MRALAQWRSVLSIHGRVGIISSRLSTVNSRRSTVNRLCAHCQRCGQHTLKRCGSIATITAALTLFMRALPQCSHHQCKHRHKWSLLSLREGGFGGKGFDFAVEKGARDLRQGES
eukprot:1611124-Rhodomonas_salina.2